MPCTFSYSGLTRINTALTNLKRVSRGTRNEAAGGEQIEPDGKYEICRQALVTGLCWGENILLTER